MAAEGSSMQYADLFEMILVERNIEDMTVWARVVAFPSFVVATSFILAAWAGLFSGSVESTVSGSVASALLFASLYLPRVTMMASQAYYRAQGKRQPQSALTFVWSVIGISLCLTMVSAVWSVNYPGVLLPYMFGLSPDQSLQSFHEQTKHDDGILLRILKVPLGNPLTTFNCFTVFAATLPHMFITSISLPPVMAIAITVLFLVYCCVCALLAIRQSFPDFVQWSPHIIYMFSVAGCVHVSLLVANVQPVQWAFSTSWFRPVQRAVGACRSRFAPFFWFTSVPAYRFLLRIAVAMASCFLFWVIGSKSIRFFVDIMFVVAFSSMIFHYFIKTQGFLIRPLGSPQAMSHPSRTGGYSHRPPLISNILTLLSCASISLPLQFLPLDWLPFGRQLLTFIGDDQPPPAGIMLTAFVVWSVLGPMLLLQHVRLPMSTLVFIYGGNLVYVNISLYYMLRNIVNSNPHPAFVLNDVLLECLSVSLCLLLLLTVSQITMQVSA
jgi:hypothetical protein